MKILLIEPSYRTKYPSMGLMKISTYHKKRGDAVEYVKGESMYVTKPDRIYITSIFTYDYHHVRRSIEFYKNLHPKVEIWLGGLAATLIPKYFENLGVDRIHQGIWSEVEDEELDYSLHPDLNTTIMFTHRGCIRKCPWCCVHIHEPEFKAKKDIGRYIERFDKISCWDNNALANPLLGEVIDVFEKSGKEIDFNQSLDIRLLTEKKAKLLTRINLFPLRFAFDNIKYKDEFLRGVEICKKVGLKQECRVDVLYNFEDTPKDFYERLYTILDTGWTAYPMLYKPIFQPNKNYLGEHWKQEDLNLYKYFCRNLLGRCGDFLNPRSYVYYQGKRTKLKEVIKGGDLNVPLSGMQRKYMHALKGKESSQLEWL